MSGPGRCRLIQVTRLCTLVHNTLIDKPTNQLFQSDRVTTRRSPTKLLAVQLHGRTVPADQLSRRVAHDTHQARWPAGSDQHAGAGVRRRDCLADEGRGVGPARLDLVPVAVVAVRRAGGAAASAGLKLRGGRGDGLLRVLLDVSL